METGHRGRYPGSGKTGQTLNTRLAVFDNQPGAVRETGIGLHAFDDCAERPDASGHFVRMLNATPIYPPFLF